MRCHREGGTLSNVAIIGSRGYPSTYGGFETLVRRLAPAIHAEGVDVCVYCRGRLWQWSTTEIDGIRCISTPGWDSKAMSTLSFGITATADAAVRQPDAALVVNVANGLFLPALRVRGIPTVVNVDGLEWNREKWGRVARAVFRNAAAVAARTADELVADSRVIANIWSAEYGVTPRFIPYGADVLPPDDGSQIRALGLEPHGYALVVARVVPENGLALQLDAFERLSFSLPLVVVGSAGYRCDLEVRLAELAARHQTVRWLGHVSDQRLLESLWLNARLYLHGHSAGGTNPALLQALGCGSPTLAFDTAFNREVLGHDEQLYSASADDLAQRIIALWDDERTRCVARGHGQEVVRSRYRWPDVCASYISALEEVALRSVGEDRRSLQGARSS